MPLLILFVLSVPAFGSLSPQAIPRDQTQNYLNEAIFEGGDPVAANLEDLRLGFHGNFERWVLDFSAPGDRERRQKVPKFLLRYERGEVLGTPGEKQTKLSPSKILISLKQIHRSFISQRKIEKLLRKSPLVENIIFYPPVEEGDRVIEIQLSKNLLFQAHQPVDQPDRLVLDLRG